MCNKTFNFVKLFSSNDESLFFLHFLPGATVSMSEASFSAMESATAAHVCVTIGSLPAGEVFLPRGVFQPQISF